MAAKVYEMDSESKTEGNLTVCFFNAWLSRGVIHFNIKKPHLRDIRVTGHLAPKSVAPNH